MKYYLHQATSVRTERGRYKLENYEIKEFLTFKECLKAFEKTFNIEGETEEVKEFDGYNISKIKIGRMSTSKSSLSPKVKYDKYDKTWYMKFNNLKSKYIGWRNFNEEDYHYGRAYANYIIFETNYKSGATEYEKEMEKFEDKRNSYFIREKKDREDLEVLNALNN